MYEEEDSLIAQLRAYGIAPEELEALVRGKESLATAGEPESSEQPPPAGEPVEQPAAPFDSLAGAPGPGPESVVEESDILRDRAAQLEVHQMREAALAEAKEAAAEIRANAVKLVSEKLQAAEDEVMAMRIQAADEVAKLRKDTARAMLSRLQEAEKEANHLRQAARSESMSFWESASEEFSGAHQQIVRVRGQLSGLLSAIDEAVTALEAAASSMASMSARQLRASNETRGDHWVD